MPEVKHVTVGAVTVFLGYAAWLLGVGLTETSARSSTTPFHTPANTGRRCRRACGAVTVGQAAPGVDCAGRRVGRVGGRERFLGLIRTGVGPLPDSLACRCGVL